MQIGFITNLKKILEEGEGQGTSYIGEQEQVKTYASALQ
mgnify:CR=1 FL=1